MDDTTLSVDQADTLRRMIYQVLNKACLCHVYDDPDFHKAAINRRCHRCNLMWDIRGAWPRAFNAAAETWTLSQKGPA